MISASSVTSLFRSIWAAQNTASHRTHSLSPSSSSSESEGKPQASHRSSSLFAGSDLHSTKYGGGSSALSSASSTSPRGGSCSTCPSRTSCLAISSTGMSSSRGLLVMASRRASSTSSGLGSSLGGMPPLLTPHLLSLPSPNLTARRRPQSAG